MKRERSLFPTRVSNTEEISGELGSSEAMDLEIGD